MTDNNPFGVPSPLNFVELQTILKEDQKQLKNLEKTFYKEIDSQDYIDTKDNYKKWIASKVLFREDGKDPNVRVTFFAWTTKWDENKKLSNQ